MHFSDQPESTAEMLGLLPALAVAPDTWTSFVEFAADALRARV
ncbi:hypothetical protein [Streptomyces sp. SID5614]|nr:hypothetical protein [Streptomyces sp. SID5614]